MKSYNRDLFILKANNIHNNNYDYSEVIYTNNKTHVIIICKKHGQFKQVPQTHLHGSGCWKCANNNKRKTTKDFIKMALVAHGNKYDYSKVVYIKNSIKIKIICRAHGLFEQNPKDHLNCKEACPICNNPQLDKNIFIKRANLIHNNLYNYSNITYKNMHKKISISCGKHGLFNQTPINHLSGHGCPKCFLTISKKELEWLDYLNIPNEYRHKTIKIDLKNYRVDAYDASTNTVYEFYGDYWHGNPYKYNPNNINANNKKFFGELYLLTIQKEKELKKYGYNIISIWESDWNKIRKYRSLYELS